jgi:hypothetical protein
MRDLSKNLEKKKAFCTRRIKRHQKSPRCPKNRKWHQCVEGRMLLTFGGASHENARKKIFEAAIRAPTPTRENPPKGSKIQPRSDGHRSTPVPLPSKQEEVKPNRHLGEMSAVNKVPEKQREGIRPKIMVEIRPMSPNHMRNPTSTHKTTTMEMCTWKTEQQRKRKECTQPNRTNN